MRNMKTATYIIIAIILFFAVNVIGSLSLTKYDLDMTDDQIFTLSKGSKQIVAKIEEPIKMKFFFSNKIATGVPVIKAYAARIRGLLEEYVSNSNGKISLEFIDPEPFSDAEDEAASFGIKGIKTDNQGTKAYFGLVMTNSVDEARVVPFFALDKEKFLEYELTRAIYDLDHPKKLKIGLLSTINMQGSSMMGIPGLPKSGGWLILDKIGETFDIVDIDTSAINIPRNIDVLMLVQPKNLSDDTLYAIDQFVLSGGKAVVFVDPNKESGGSGNPSDRGFSPEFNRLLNSWGVKIDPYNIVGDRNAARKYTKPAPGQEDWMVADYVAWLGLTEENINRNDVTTSAMKTINMATAGSIEKSGTKNFELIPLLKTSKKAAKIPVNKVRNAPDPNDLLTRFIPTDKEYLLAVRISGNADTAFPERNSAKGHISSSVNAINVVVIADSDILADENWADARDIQGYKLVTQTADNGALIANIIDHLGGSNDLISIRSRSAADRPFIKVDELKRNAEERYLAKEHALKDKLAATERKLASLQQQAQNQSSNALIYKNEQQDEIRKFTNEMVSVKRELRDVQGDLLSDIKRLGSILKFINIWLMPILISAFAIFIFLIRGRVARVKGV